MTYVSRLFMVFLLHFFGIVNLLNEIKKSAERVTERGRSDKQTPLNGQHVLSARRGFLQSFTLPKLPLIRPSFMTAGE